MKKVAIRVGAGLAVVIAVLLIVIATRPSAYRVERHTTIAAPLDLVFTKVKDFRTWEAWSPWAKLDPNMKTTFTGNQGEVGAGYAWEGNDEVGAGRMTIAAIKPNERVDIKLEFLKPFESKTENGFAVEAAGKETKITWFMSGENDFVGKAFCLFMDMDAMIGKDFENGLANLKKVAEEAAKTEAPPAAAETVNAAAPK
ncbi:SRPBCC family protein [Polyangium jinanense]|uniref:SRPBCC family protein n=1 Tax=Polyangium jinanense TaxID=2829994 RepID=A0A9X3X412_9BACT|nr:SRPBCC family protein [Polyangium jinanense]MDC3958356.1 SRPBCC family protein [Polyangium jinanense]MDC3983309.1 SRPBCC family protein [Polyangium jinanense]